jgi:Na+-driven multidrug efflux pump
VAFSDDPNVRAMFKTGLIVGSLSAWFMSSHSFITAPLHALGKKKLIAKMYITCLVIVLLPLQYVLTFVVGMGLDGIFTGLCITHFMLIVIAAIVSYTIDYRDEIAKQHQRMSDERKTNAEAER